MLRSNCSAMTAALRPSCAKRRSLSSSSSVHRELAIRRRSLIYPSVTRIFGNAIVRDPNEVVTIHDLVISVRTSPASHYGQHEPAVWCRRVCQNVSKRFKARPLFGNRAQQIEQIAGGLRKYVGFRCRVSTVHPSFPVSGSIGDTIDARLPRAAHCCASFNATVSSSRAPFCSAVSLTWNGSKRLGSSETRISFSQTLNAVARHRFHIRAEVPYPT